MRYEFRAVRLLAAMLLLGAQAPLPGQLPAASPGASQGTGFTVHTSPSGPAIPPGTVRAPLQGGHTPASRHAVKRIKAAHVRAARRNVKRAKLRRRPVLAAPAGLSPPPGSNTVHTAPSG